MTNFIIVNYFFKTVIRHWSVFCHYLDPLDSLSLKKVSKIINNNELSNLSTTKNSKNHKNIKNKNNTKKSKINSIAPIDNTNNIKPFSSKINIKLNKSWDFTFLFPIFHMTFCAIFGNVYLVYAAFKKETKNKITKFDFTLENLLSSPYMLFHQVFPKLMWPQSDVCDTIGILGAIAIYCSFLRNPVKIGSKYTLVLGKGNGTLLKIGKNELTEPDSVAILAYHRRIHKPAMACLIFFILATLAFSYLNVFFVHRLFQTTLRDIFFWFVVYPLHVCYVLYAIFALIHFPIMAIKFLQIRQQSQLTKLSTLVEQLNLTTSKSSLPSGLKNRKFLEGIWRQTVLLNRAYGVLCVDIAAVSRFWSPFLTIFFLEHITLQAYMAYIVFIIKTLPFAQKIFFLYALVEVDVLLFVLISRCAKIVKLNQAVERVNAKVYRKLFTEKINNKRNSNKVVHRVILKAEWLQVKNRLQPYCMVLLDNYRITSKTFYVLISYIAVFFLMIFKKQ